MAQIGNIEIITIQIELAPKNHKIIKRKALIFTLYILGRTFGLFQFCIALKCFL